MSEYHAEQAEERDAESAVRHRTRRMTGRDPNEEHRPSTPLELLFDLTFVVAFGTAANALAHDLSHDHIAGGIVAFCFATFAVSWGWINFTWFASAYDTDDWVYRLTTMLQMVGVLVFALGIPPMFASVHGGDTLDNDVMVWGYVVMRVAMIFQWWRASLHDPGRRDVCRSYIASITVAQVLWCVLAVVDLPVATTFAVMVIPFLLEIGGPAYAERRRAGTPWHPHHVAERYGLMVIIALGEGMIGTMVSLTALAEEGLSPEVALIALAGTALTFGIWWNYFVVPHGEVLEARRERSFGWGYGHMVLFGAIVAIGAGLHVAAYYLDHTAHLSLTATVLTVVVPVAVFTVTFYVGYGLITRTFDPFHVVLLAISGVTLVVPVVMAAAGVGLVGCLLVLALTPWVTVVGYETKGYRHNIEVLESLRSQA